MQPCPVCQQSAAKTQICEVTIRAEKSTPLLACGICHVKYFADMPSNTDLQDFYNSRYYSNFDNHKLYFKGSQFAKRLMRQKAKGNFLDVGCSTGKFLHGVAQHSNWNVIGVDIDEQIAATARQEYNLDVRVGELEEVAFYSEYFDFIHIGDVLEHVRDPRRFLAECSRILSPTGMIYLSVPNGFVDSVNIIRFAQETGSPALSPDGHLYFYSTTALKVLFSQAHLKIEKAKTYNIKNGLRGLGLLPAKKSWRDVYTPQFLNQQKNPELQHQPLQAKHSTYYLNYRFKLKQMMMIPGLHKFGLDYIIYLSKEMS